MGHIGIPKNYTASPSSFGGTSLTINYDATQDLDSSNAFEGLSMKSFFACSNANFLNQALRSCSRYGLRHPPPSLVRQAPRV